MVTLKVMTGQYENESQEERLQNGIWFKQI
jgi:hypothetical protein